MEMKLGDKNETKNVKEKWRNPRQLMKEGVDKKIYLNAQLDSKLIALITWLGLEVHWLQLHKVHLLKTGAIVHELYVCGYLVEVEVFVHECKR